MWSSAEFQLARYTLIKKIAVVALSLCWLLEGCASTATIRTAKGLPSLSPNAHGQPAFYLLLPLTVPVDVVGTPFFYLLWHAHRDGDASCKAFFKEFSDALSE
jgi:hypothetical protein